MSSEHGMGGAGVGSSKFDEEGFESNMGGA